MNCREGKARTIEPIQTTDQVLVLLFLIVFLLLCDSAPQELGDYVEVMELAARPATAAALVLSLPF